MKTDEVTGEITVDGYAVELFPPLGIVSCFRCCAEARRDGPVSPPRDGVVWAIERLNGRRRLVPYCDVHAQARIRVVADERRQQWGVWPDRPIEADSYWVGLLGETWFAKETGLAVDFVNGEPDGGVDFVTRRGTRVDVKTTRLSQPRWTIRPGAADLYVLLALRSDGAMRLGFEMVGGVRAEHVAEWCAIGDDASAQLSSESSLWLLRPVVCEGGSALAGIG